MITSMVCRSTLVPQRDSNGVVTTQSVRYKKGGIGTLYCAIMPPESERFREGHLPSFDTFPKKRFDFYRRVTYLNCVSRIAVPCSKHFRTRQRKAWLQNTDEWSHK